MIKPAGLHAELQAFVDGLAGLESAGTLAAERANWAAFCLASNPPRPSHITREERSLELPGRSLPARLYRSRPHERLLAAGTPARYRCARGMVHGFIRARLAGPAAGAEFEAICAFLRESLDST